MARLGPPLTVAPFATSETQSTTEYTGVFGNVYIDPGIPADKYMLVDCQAAFVVGEIVVISATGTASRITSTSAGQIGVIVATVSTSDTAAWAQVEGTNASAILTSGVTTADFTMAPATTDGGYLDLLTSTEANVAHGVRCTVVPSTATTPFSSATEASALVGVGTIVLMPGGSYVYGIAHNVGITT